MENKIDFFENGDYKFITNLIDKKMYILKKCENFNKQYMRLYDVMEEFGENLEDRQKEQFNEIVRLFYNTEEYYLALAYSLGIKYGNDLKKLINLDFAKFISFLFC